MTGGARRIGNLSSSELERLRATLVAAVRDADPVAATVRPPTGQRQQTYPASTEVLPEAARLHRVTGVVRRGIDGVGGIPTEVRAELQASAHCAAIRQLIFVGALADIARRFDEVGLSWLVMKGPVVSARLYTCAGDREYGDLDLLVARHDFPAAVLLLEDLGYAHLVQNWALAESMLAGQVVMFTEQVEVDLHWHLHYSRDARRAFGVVPEEMLERSRRVEIHGVVVPTFDAVDNLLTLCYHAARSDGHRLVWLKDVERALVVDAPDLDELVRRAHHFGVAPPVGLILARSERILGAPVPDEVVAELLSPVMHRAEEWICRRVDPIQFHERQTITRAFTRSVYSSDRASIASIPRRSVTSLRRRLFEPPENETDDASEKASYLRAVVASR